MPSSAGEPRGIPAPATLSRKAVVSWCLYDFANSAFSAVVVGTIFGVWYAKTVVGNDAGQGDLWWGRAISLSMLVVALSSPVVGGVADRAGLRRRIWMGYTLACVLAVAGFTTLAPGDVLPGFLLMVVANAGMEGAFVLYNSYLPDVAPPTHLGRVSGWGFATGYLGSIVALVAALPLVVARRFDLVWLLVAAHFALFALPAFLFLPRDPPPRLSTARAAAHGLGEVWGNLRELLRDRGARRFLLAYVFYEDGVNTVIVFSSVFAAKTLAFPEASLIPLYIVVQLSALAGAWAMARPTDTRGPKLVIVLALLLWCGVVTAAYFVTTQGGFWGVAVVAGLGLGSVQAASRSMFASFVPEGREAQYFGVYALVGKSAAVMGPALFGQISSAFGGNQRPAILSVSALYLVGLVLLAGVPDRRAELARARRAAAAARG